MQKPVFQYGELPKHYRVFATGTDPDANFKECEKHLERFTSATSKFGNFSGCDGGWKDVVQIGMTGQLGIMTAAIEFHEMHKMRSILCLCAAENRPDVAIHLMKNKIIKVDEHEIINACLHSLCCVGIANLSLSRAQDLHFIREIIKKEDYNVTIEKLTEKLDDMFRLNDIGDSMWALQRMCLVSLKTSMEASKTR